MPRGGAPHPDDDPARVAPDVVREPTFPRIEHVPRDVEEPLGDEERIGVGELDEPPADLCADFAAEKQRMEIRPLDAGVAVASRAVAHRELGADRERCVAVHVDDHRDRRRDVIIGSHGGEARERGACTVELRAVVRDRVTLDRACRVAAAATSSSGTTQSYATTSGSGPAR